LIHGSHATIPDCKDIAPAQLQRTAAHVVSTRPACVVRVGSKANVHISAVHDNGACGLIKNTGPARRKRVSADPNIKPRRETGTRHPQIPRGRCCVREDDKAGEDRTARIIDDRRPPVVDPARIARAWRNVRLPVQRIIPVAHGAVPEKICCGYG